MAKSLRSKSKRSYRAKKRESGKYAVADAARLNRLNAKLAGIKEREHEKDSSEETQEGDAEDSMGVDDHAQLQDAVANTVDDGEGMAVDEPEKSGRVSTHGPRGSRREEWRKSKGMDPIPKRHGMNRQGGLAARRKAGRPSRRR